MSVEFIDTNVLVYAHALGADVRYLKSVDLIARITEEGSGATSTQVLSEFYATVTGKYRMTPADAEEVIRDFSDWTIHRPDHADILRSIHLQQRHKISWWDALIINSAIESGAQTLWTEDLHDGQRFGSLTIRNPFKD